VSVTSHNSHVPRAVASSCNVWASTRPDPSPRPAAELRDKAAAIVAYVRQRNDTELEVWFSEIRLRASIRIGELVRDLESKQGARSELLPTAGKKLEAIADAGLSKTDAYRCQELAGSKHEMGASAAPAAAEAHFAQARAEKRPATMESLRGAMKEAIVATLGPVPERPAAAARLLTLAASLP
jgi:hypothetical protein